MFGVGMALVGTCGSARLFGLVAVTSAPSGLSCARHFCLHGASGPTALLHLWYLDPLAVRTELFADPRLHVVLTKLTGVSATFVPPAIAVVLIAWVLANSKFRGRPGRLAWGIIVGLIVASGWIGTGWLVYDEFDPQPLVSYTFIHRWVPASCTP